MKKFFALSLTHLIALISLCGTTAQAQNTSAPPPADSRKPLTIASLPKPAPTKWKRQDDQVFELRGQLSFAVTQGNEDDTLTGWMLYLLPDAERERLAKHIGQPLKSIPPYVMKTEVIATWTKGASCPLIRMESGAVEFEILGGKIHFNSVTLYFQESQNYLPQLFCHWTRQINTHRQRRSIIAAINRALKGEDPE